MGVLKWMVLLSLILLFSTGQFAKAQVAIQGKYRNSVLPKHFDGPVFQLPAIDNSIHRLANHLGRPKVAAMPDATVDKDSFFTDSLELDMAALKDDTPDPITEKAVKNEPLKSTHFKFGVKIPVSIDISKDGHWRDLPNGSGKMWKLRIHSPNSFSLNILCDQFKLPSGAELYIKGEQHRIGAFTAEVNNKPHGRFATAPIEGRLLELEYYEPINVTEQVELHICYIVHGFRPHGELIDTDTLVMAEKENQALFEKYQSHLEKRDSEEESEFVELSSNLEADATADTLLESPHKLGRYIYRLQTERYTSGECHINAPNCREAAPWINQIRSTVLIMTAEGTGYCTGSLINNAKQDGRQLLLTANHCIHDASRNDYRYNIVIFNYHASSCIPHESERDSSTLIPNNAGKTSDGKRQKRGVSKLLQSTAQGLKLLASSSITDFALLEIEETIPSDYEAYLAGWSISETTPPYSVCIHHALGGFKKISILNDTLQSVCWGQSCAGTTDPSSAKLQGAPGWEITNKPGESSHWYIRKWSRGATEIGSSGAPLFSSKGLCIGQLQGGESDCDNLDGHDIFGALSMSMKYGLEAYLNPGRMLATDRLTGGYLKDIRERAAKAATESTPPLILRTQLTVAVASTESTDVS